MRNQTVDLQGQVLMKIVNFGSLNVDHVYAVEHFVGPGETIASSRYSRFCGGKGLNQSIALGRAGAVVVHAGMIGADGEFLRDVLNATGVDTSLVRHSDSATGHAVIQVTPQGENAIIVEGGANHQIDQSLIDETMTLLSSGDWLLVQNELNGVEKIMAAATGRGINVALNPAPMTSTVKDYPLEGLNTLIVNEVEGAQLTGGERPEEIVNHLLSRHPGIRVVLTLGEKGAIFADSDSWIEQKSFPVTPVDTTAAGDTFIGYFLPAIAQGQTPQAALRLGCLAASLCVTKNGAADSIPTRMEVEAFDRQSPRSS